MSDLVFLKISLFHSLHSRDNLSGYKIQEQHSNALRVLLHCLLALSVAVEKCDDSSFLFFLKSSAPVKYLLEFFRCLYILKFLYNVAGIDFFLISSI